MPSITSESDTPFDAENNWQIKGKLGVRTPEDSTSVTLDWLQHQQNYRIRLVGPLGQGSALIEGDSNFITITQPGKPPLSSNNPSELIINTFGWQLPLEDFQYWVRGVTSPSGTSANTTYDESGALSFLEQSQWSLDYSRYQKVADRQLPGRIQARNGDVKVTLIIREWLLK